MVLVGVSPEQYLELERAATEKHEFIDGVMVAMGVGSLLYSRIASNLIRNLPMKNGGRNCEVQGSDLRVGVHWSRLITYPNVTVVCGKMEFADERRDTVTNPVLLVEVLSPFTEEHDRGKKAYLYRAIPSLREFLLIRQIPVEIDHYKITRWEDSLELVSLGCRFPVAGVYEGFEGY